MSIIFPGIGPISRMMLAAAGIVTAAQLQTLGSVAAYARVKRCGANPSLNLLWGLEAAISGKPWQQVAREDRLPLLMALEDFEKGDRPSADSANRCDSARPT